VAHHKNTIVAALVNFGWRSVMLIFSAVVVQRVFGWQWQWNLASDNEWHGRGKESGNKTVSSSSAGSQCWSGISLVLCQKVLCKKA